MIWPRARRGHVISQVRDPTIWPGARRFGWEPGGLSGSPPGICAAHSDFGAAQFGAAPVVAGGAVITVSLGGAGRTRGRLPSIGVADCAYTRPVAARIAAPVNTRVISSAEKPSVAFLRRFRCRVSPPLAAGVARDHPCGTNNFGTNRSVLHFVPSSSRSPGRSPCPRGFHVRPRLPGASSTRARGPALAGAHL
jgi:hypothetical protein